MSGQDKSHVWRAPARIRPNHQNFRAITFAIACQDVFSRIALALFQALETKAKSNPTRHGCVLHQLVFLSYIPFLIYFIKFHMLFWTRLSRHGRWMDWL